MAKSADIKNIKRVYGRRLGRPLNKSRSDVIETLLPKLSIPKESLTETGDLNPKILFPTPKTQTWFEIGFGAGEHLSALMRRHPGNAYLGAEPYINGMSAFLKDISPPTLTLPPTGGGMRRVGEAHAEHTSKLGGGDIPLKNIRLIMDDAMILANSLSDNSLDGIYILNPDPWHKKRHHKRRIVSKENLDTFARILKPGGQLIMSTDVPYLAEWMLTRAITHPAFTWTAQSRKDWEIPPPDWITTAYEKKGAKGAEKMRYLFFEKKT